MKKKWFRPVSFVSIMFIVMAMLNLYVGKDEIAYSQMAIAVGFQILFEIRGEDKKYD